MTHQEFKIESMPKQLFRVGKISPVDLLAISQTVDFKDYEANRCLNAFCLENAEAFIGNTWVPVKVKGKDVYQPMGIESDFVALSEIYLWMLQNVVAKAFTKSSGSTQKTE